MEKKYKNIIWSNNILRWYMGFGYLHICIGFTVADSIPLPA